MGGLDLDPATCEEAQAEINAPTYYTKKENGLARPWFGRVFLNPPYSMPLIEEFTQKVIEEYDTGRIDQAVVLVNNCTDTKVAILFEDSCTMQQLPDKEIIPERESRNPLRG